MPRPLSLSLILLTALAGPAAAESRMTALAAPPDERGAPCTADGSRCVLLTPSGDGSPRPVVRATGASGPLPAPMPRTVFSAESYAAWPHFVELEGGGFLAGVLAEATAAYSGGGGSATELRLFHVTAEGQAGAEPVLAVPVEGSLTIRACFSEKDMQRRRGACQDEYRFSGRLELAGGTAGGRPVLAYATEASAYPRGASRSRDSSRMPPLRPGDLVRERDARCSVTRRFLFDAGAQAYRPDAPLPACPDYTVP